MKSVKLALVLAGAAMAATMAGCASTPQAKDGSAPVAASSDRCHVTGSNLPKRDCRNDVSVLPPSEIENVLPKLPSAAPRN